MLSAIGYPGGRLGGANYAATFAQVVLVAFRGRHGRVDTPPSAAPWKVRANPEILTILNLIEDGKEHTDPTIRPSEAAVVLPCWHCTPAGFYLITTCFSAQSGERERVFDQHTPNLS